VRCVDDVGYARTTSQRIAKEAGVSVGAVQHHFASKADILTATLEDSFERLSAAFDGASADGASLERRVGVFVDRAWRHYGSARFRSTLEIIYGTRDQGDGAAGDWAAKPIHESAQRAEALWSAFFGEYGIKPRERQEILRFALVTLSGMAMSMRLSDNPSEMGRQLAMLKTALLALLKEAIAK
jgi:AcrR family transcriptional regulator